MLTLKLKRIVYIAKYQPRRVLLLTQTAAQPGICFETSKLLYRHCSKYSKNKKNWKEGDIVCVWENMGCTDHPASKGRGSTSSLLLSAAQVTWNRHVRSNLVFEACQDKDSSLWKESNWLWQLFWQAWVIHSPRSNTQNYSGWSAEKQGFVERCLLKELPSHSLSPCRLSKKKHRRF